jgi:hypothetical protein
MFQSVIGDDQIKTPVWNSLKRFVDFQTSFPRYGSCHRIDFHPDALPAVQVGQ